LQDLIKKVRAPNLTNDSIQMILGIIDSWAEKKLTWNALIFVIETSLGAAYTRQALAGHQAIQIAYNSKNKILANTPVQETRSSAVELDEALVIIETQRAEIARLKIAENQFLEQFARWASNAYLLGIDYKRLDQAVDMVDRDSSLHVREVKIR
jgi:hypothetical protein